MSLGTGKTSALEQVNHTREFKTNVAYHIHRFKEAMEKNEQEVVDVYLQKQYALAFSSDDRVFVIAAFDIALNHSDNKAIKALASYCSEKGGDALVKMTQGSNHDGVDFFRSLCKLDKDKFDIERAFEAAIEYATCDIFKMLHESYAALFDNPKYTQALYRRAASYKRYDICEFLLINHFIKINPDDINDSFLNAAAFGVTSFIKYIVENHFKTITPEKRVESLENTATFEDLIAFKLILQQCGSELSPSDFGNVLWRLCKKGALTAVQLLMTYATPEKLKKISNEVGEALIEATFNHKEDVALYLIAEFADYISDPAKACAFSTASITGCTKVIKLVSEKWRHLITPELLELAVRSAMPYHHEIMSFLLENFSKQFKHATLAFTLCNAAYIGNSDRIKFILGHCLDQLHPKDIEDAAGHAKAAHPDLAQLIISATPTVLTFRKQETGQQKLVSDPAAKEATTKKKKKHPAKQ